MDPGQEWDLWRAWLGGEPSGRTIYAAAVELLLFRNIWKEFAIIHDRAPEEARKNATFLRWVLGNYARSMGSAIRRQVDIRNDVISLARLIDRVWRYPTVLTRERFRSLQGSASDLADGWFDQLAGPGDFINPEIPAQDMEHLRSRTGTVRNWINNAVAHTGVKELSPPPLQEIHDCVDVIYGLFQKYAELIMGVHVHKGVVMTPWSAIFRVSWIPDDDHWKKVVEEAQAAIDD